MIMALKKVPAAKGTKLKVGGDDDYKSAMVKGKGPTKMQDVAKAKIKKKK